MKYINIGKIKDLFKDNIVLVKTSSIALASVVLLTGCGKNDKIEENAEAISDLTQAVAELTDVVNTLVNEENEVVIESNEEVEESTEEEVDVDFVEYPDTDYTTEEKIAFVNENVVNFMNEVNSIEGINLDANAARIQLGFINGLSDTQVEATTYDYVLDFITDYENIWNKLTVETMNNLVGDYAISENKATYGNIYGKYILDGVDRTAYEYFANKTLRVVDLAYNGNKEAASKLAIEKNTLNAEVLLLDNSFYNIDINNVSEEVQYIMRYIAYLDTHFLEENTVVKVNTIVGEEDYINYNDNTQASHYSTDDGAYTITGNIGNDMSYFLERDSVNVTMKYWLGPGLCSYNKNDTKKLVKEL